MAFSESAGCEGSGIACAGDIHETRCIDEGGWAILGWISDTELLLHDSPYAYPVHLRPPRVFDASSGSVRQATPGEDRPRALDPGPHGGELAYDDIALEFRLDGHDVLHVPAQQVSQTIPHALSPDERAFVFTIAQSDRRVRSVWVAMTDGSQRAWPLIEGITYAAWQPAVPVHPAWLILAAVRRATLRWLALANAR